MLAPKCTRRFTIGITLVNNIPKILPLLKQQVADGLNNAGAFFVLEAQNNANVDTGFMKAHILMAESEMATPERPSTIVRSLAPYSRAQDQGIHGNLFFTRAWAATRLKFKQFMYSAGRSAGPNVVRAALEEFHGPMGRKGGGF